MLASDVDPASCVAPFCEEVPVDDRVEPVDPLVLVAVSAVEEDDEWLSPAPASLELESPPLEPHAASPTPRRRAETSLRLRIRT